MSGPVASTHFLEDGIKGLTVVNEEIFVLFNSLKIINVHKRDSDYIEERLVSRVINLPRLKLAQDLTGCAYNRALYISDSRLQCIQRVDLANDSVTHWAMRENYVPCGLSVTGKHTLLVTVWIRGTASKSRVVEYTSGGQRLRIISISRSIKHAWQTVQLSSDQFIVCHGWYSLSPHRICVINSGGHILRSYGNKMNIDPIIKSYGIEMNIDEEHLNFPSSLAIDYNRKQIYVADCFNNRVLLLTYDLTLVCTIFTPSGLRKPNRLNFSDDRLYIAGTSYAKKCDDNYVKSMFAFIGYDCDLNQIQESNRSLVTGAACRISNVQPFVYQTSFTRAPYASRSHLSILQKFALDVKAVVYWCDNKIKRSSGEICFPHKESGKGHSHVFFSVSLDELSVEEQNLEAELSETLTSKEEIRKMIAEHRLHSYLPKMNFQQVDWDFLVWMRDYQRSQLTKIIDWPYVEAIYKVYQ